MIKGIILDFDQTIVDTLKIEYLRDIRKWDSIKAFYEDISLIPGIKDLLRYTCTKNLLVAIVSNSPRKKYIEGILLYFDINVDYIIGYEDIKSHKPSPDSMKLALIKMGLKPDEVVAIGDSIKDAEAANRAYIKNIYFSDHKNDKIEYHDFQSTDYREIIEFIEKL